MNKEQLRKKYRQQRSAFSPEQRQKASHQICLNLAGLSGAFRRVAVYLATPEEVDLSEYIQWAWSGGIEIAAPFLEEGMQFRQYAPKTRLIQKKWGIFEPESDAPLMPLESCDAVCVPLVAVDSNLNRIGMGGGYYDRALNACLSLQKRPIFIGCAFDFQKVKTLPADPWDVPLDLLVTER